MGSRNSALFERAAYGLAAASSVLLLWRHRLLPLQDYPDWLYQGALFADLLRGRLPAAFDLAGFLAPNAVSTIVIGLLSLLVPPETAGKLFLSAYVAGFLATGRGLLKALPEGSALRLLPALFVWNFSVLHGNINYAFSLCVFFFAVAYLIRHEERSNPLIIGLCSIGLYVCHGMTFLAFSVMVAALSIGRRSIVLALSLGPSLLVAFAYTARQFAKSDPAESSAGGFAVASFASFKAATLIKFFAPFALFQPFHAPIQALAPWLVAGNVAVFALLVWLLRAAPRKVLRDRPWLGWSLLALSALYVLFPRSIAGIVNPGERLIFPVVFVLAAFAPAISAPRWASQVLAVGLVLQLAFLAGYGTFVVRRMNALHAAVARRTRGSDFAVVQESHFRSKLSTRERTLPSVFRLLPSHHPLLREPFLVSLERRSVAPIFQTGLFEYSGPDTIVTSLEELTAAGLPSVLVVIGDRAGSAELEQIVSSTYHRVERGDGFSILSTNGIGFSSGKASGQVDSSRGLASTHELQSQESLRKRAWAHPEGTF